MDNKPNNMHNFKEKFSNIFRKESFYVVLFICLCVIALVGAVTLSIKKGKTQNDVGKNTKIEQKTANQEHDNALFVKNDTTNEEKDVQLKKSGKKLQQGALAVASASKPNFTKPVQGKIIQEYSEVPVLAIESDEVGSKTYKTNLGVNIEAKLGTAVNSAADGIVELIGENPKGFGYMVVINHQNGYKTVYANLDQKVSVKKDEKVKAGQQIGKVGNTSLRVVKNNNKETSYAHFSILEGNESFKELDFNNKYINPAKFIK